VRSLVGLLRGFPGHPSHPPLTDATIGAFTIGTVLTVVSWIGVYETEAVHAGMLALVTGLLLAIPTIVTGFVDYLDIPRGVPRWRTATLHWLSMVSAVGVFLVAAALLQGDFDAGAAGAAGASCAILGLLVLAVGGWLGGTVVFVHGERVLSHADEPTTSAIVPHGIEREPVPEVDAPEGRA
jgi:uncharacterized membrane protein